MSRSYKKHPCWGDDSCNGIHSCVHYYKNYANRLVRKTWHWDVPSGGAYRRVFDSWNIRDYQSTMYTKQEVMDAIEENNRDMANEAPPHKHPYGIYKLENPERYRKYSLMYYYYAK